MRSRNLRSHRK